MEQAPSGGIPAGTIVYWAEREAYFEIRSSVRRGGRVSVLPLTGDMKRVLELSLNDIFVLPPFEQRPPGFDLVVRYAFAHVPSGRRSGFLNFVRGRKFPNEIKRRYGTLVAEQDIGRAIAEYEDEFKPKQAKGKSIRAIHEGDRKYCVRCGGVSKRPFSKGPPVTPAHPACQKALRFALIHFCTYCGARFERRDMPNLLFIYWRRAFSCPPGALSRTAR